MVDETTTTRPACPEVLPTNPRPRRYVPAAFAALVLVLIAAGGVRAVQIQDIIRIKGAEANKLVGMGLVVGLRGTGDGGKYLPAMRRLAAMMNRLGDPNVIAHELKDVENVALVEVTANLPAVGVREGDRVDVHLASVGPASSLEGGRLVITPLLGPVPGSPIFAFASGALTIENDDVPTVGVVREGATLTRDVMSRYMDEFGRMAVVLDTPHATVPMANTIATLINDLMAPDAPPIAMAIDGKNVIIEVPQREQANPSAFISQVLEIHLDPSLVRTEARVVINERTGTIVMTGDVHISPVVISHKGLTITTVAPKAPPTPQNPEVEEKTFVGIDPSNRAGAELADLMAAFNQLKVPAEDRIAIIKEIWKSGKLLAQLVVEN